MIEAVDLFAGPGGWDEGLLALGIQPVGIERDESACLTRRAAGHNTVRADIAELDPEDFRPCDLLIASPPCQAFSTARIFQPGGHHEPGEQSKNGVRVQLHEAAILQSFPVDYPWQGSRTKQFEQVGNAVPPLLARAVIVALLGIQVHTTFDESIDGSVDERRAA